jgi:hypothetical protein
MNIPMFQIAAMKRVHSRVRRGLATDDKEVKKIVCVFQMNSELLAAKQRSCNYHEVMDIMHRCIRYQYPVVSSFVGHPQPTPESVAHRVVPERKRI